jgi:hypothetical protein
MINGLINKTDNSEIIRDQIAGILAAESASQQAKAQAANLDPALWALRVFAERSTLFEFDAGPPCANVYLDSLSYDRSKSDTTTRQHTNGLFNIDLYGFGMSTDDPTGGHFSGDEMAAKEVQRAIRLVRNILNSGYYNQLRLSGIVADKWIQSVNISHAPANNAYNVCGARIVLAVNFNEFGPLEPAPAIEKITLIHNKIGALIYEY